MPALSKTDHRIDILSLDDHLSMLVRDNLNHRASMRHKRHEVRHIRSLKRLREKQGDALFVLSRLDQAQYEIFSSLGYTKNNVYYLFVQPKSCDPASIDRLDAMGAFKQMRNWHVHQTESKGDERKIIHRWIYSWLHGDEDERILDIAVLDRELIVVTKSLKKMLLKLNDIAPLAGRSPEILKNFEIDEDGSFVYWPKIDVHLGWDEFLIFHNPKEALKARLKTAEFARRYGEAIRKLRVEDAIRQEDVAGLEARQLRRIEHGQSRPTVTSLSKLANAHGLTLNGYLNELSKQLVEH